MFSTTCRSVDCRAYRYAWWRKCRGVILCDRSPVTSMRPPDAKAPCGPRAAPAPCGRWAGSRAAVRFGTPDRRDVDTSPTGGAMPPRLGGAGSQTRGSARHRGHSTDSCLDRVFGRDTWRNGSQCGQCRHPIRSRILSETGVDKIQETESGDRDVSTCARLCAKLWRNCG